LCKSCGLRDVTAGSSTGQPNSLKLWDTTNGREVFSANLPPAIITAIAFSHDGHRLAAATTALDLMAGVTGRKVPSEIHLWDATPVAVEAPIKSDAAQLQGTWIVVSAELNGAVAKSSAGDKFSFDGGKVTICYGRQRPTALDSRQGLLLTLKREPTR
jgi:WD40 repeat protein